MGDPYFLEDEEESSSAAYSAHNDGHGEGHAHESPHGSDDAPLKPPHAHDNFGSIGLEAGGDICPDKLRNWLRSVVEEHGDALIRLKGVLHSTTGRLIVQGVGHIDISDPDSSA